MLNEESPASFDGGPPPVPLAVTARAVQLAVNIFFCLCTLIPAGSLPYALMRDYAKTGSHHLQGLTSTIFVELLFCGIFIAMTVHVLRKYHREKRLLIWGSAARAEIDKKLDYRGKNGRHYYVIHSSFRAQPAGKLYFGRPFRSNPDGMIYGGKVSALPINTPKIHLDEPVVFYDPAAPEINAFYPMEMVRLAEESASNSII